MTTDPITRSRKLLDAAGILVRWVVGGLFIYMGMKKALDPVTFLKLVRQYEMTNSPLVLNSIAATLPWFETFCGLLLLAGVAVRGTAVMLLAMLLPFTAVVWHRALAIAATKALPFCAVKFDCGCGMGEVFICGKLAENSILIVLAAWMLWGSGRKLCARFSLLP